MFSWAVPAGRGGGSYLINSLPVLALEMVASTRLPTRTFGILMSPGTGDWAMVGIIFLSEHLLFTMAGAELHCHRLHGRGTLTIKPKSKIKAVE